tara:strand:- start:17577 stop:18206 length:630 start_codon:yes stop_codon:yes gene_type:complete
MLTQLRLRLILTAVFALCALSSVTQAQPGVREYPPRTQEQSPQQPAAYYNGGYSQLPNLQLLTTEELDIYRRGEISPLETIGGGLVSAWAGFGLGHAVQGRYSDVGWMFTLGEVASLGVAVLGAIQVGQRGNSQRFDNADTMLLAGVLSYGVLRVWEFVDTLAGPSAHNRRYRALRSKVYGHAPPPRYGFFVTPGSTRGGGTAGFSIHF